MSDTSSSDILVKFVIDRQPVAGESGAALSAVGKTPHKLLSGFRRGGIFSVKTFTFAVGVQDPDGSSALPPDHPNHPQNQRNTRLNSQGQKDGSDQDGDKKAPASTRGLFKGWRSGRSSTKYPVAVQPITFTRIVDRSSTELLHHFIRHRTFDSATIVKRKAAGGGIAGEPYLRLDFSTVLITNIAWSNDDQVTETVQFISRAITVQYRPQLSDGTLGAIRSGFWSMNPAEREAIL